MALTSLVQRAFSSGELSPGVGVRADVPRYTTGARTIRNHVVLRSGGVANRAGTKYVATAKTASATYIFPFLFAAADQSFLVEAGEGYFRFHRNGSPVVVSGVTAWSNATAYVVGDLASRLGVNYYCILAHTNQQPPSALYWYAFTGAIYEIPTPYTAGMFIDPAPLCWSQAGPLVTITHLNLAPRELVYQGVSPYGDTPPRWVLRLVSTAPSISPPTALGSTGSVAGDEVRSYVVTALKAETYEESIASAALALTDIALPTAAAPIVVTFTEAAGAVEHDVYCDVLGNGVFGFIGTTLEAFFNDPGLAPDFGLTPPLARVLFASTDHYPAVSVVHQQRRIFAGTHTDREQVFGSQVGKLSNFSIRSPLQDDDAVTWKLASNRLQVVMHLVGLKQLVVLTDTGEWLVLGADGVLKPTGINLDQHGYVGSSFLAPVIIGNAIVFVQARGTVLRDLRFDETSQGLSGRDLTVVAGHLFRGYTLVDLEFQQQPDSVIWCVRSDGTLLGCTYVREDDLWGWHRHDTTNGTFEQVVVLPEGAHDAVYVVVKRTIGGSTVRYIERIAARVDAPLTDAYFLDCGATKTGASSTSVTGLAHLNGQTVYALADGVVRGPLTVAGGAVTLPVAAVTAHVGLRITSDLETLDVDVQGSALRDKRKRVQSISVLVDASSRGFLVGPDATHLLAQRPEGWQTAGVTGSGSYEINLTAACNDSGRTLIRHQDPTPLTILGLVPQLQIGG